MCPFSFIDDTYVACHRPTRSYPASSQTLFQNARFNLRTNDALPLRPWPCFHYFVVGRYAPVLQLRACSYSSIGCQCNNVQKVRSYEPSESLFN